ncbi:Alpha/Beta hydrolase protein [Panaeolus papilionaceus]|nr:Alpha/Beta hydrolase protein [Panaeolus papilionaceus]
MSSASGFSTKTFVFDPRPTFPYVSVVKRYWVEGSPYLSDKAALTLFFAHGTSLHKELWEPIIDDLRAANDIGGAQVKIREIWTIDAPNHGESAALNREALMLIPNVIFPWEDYSRSIHMFLNGLGTGVESVNFSEHKLVGIGHSMGATAIGLAQGFYPKIKWEALVLCEPMIMPLESGKDFIEVLGDGAMKRRDIWPSREEAYRTFTDRGRIWRTWDPRVRRLFVEHGLVSLPNEDYPDKEGVTLACSKLQEAACYRDSIGLFRLHTALKHVAEQFPTHLISGGEDDYNYLTVNVKEGLVYKAAGGIENLASSTRVEGGGHLVPQSNPKKIAEQIHKILLSHWTHRRSQLHKAGSPKL